MLEIQIYQKKPQTQTFDLILTNHNNSYPVNSNVQRKGSSLVLFPSSQTHTCWCVWHPCVPFSSYPTNQWKKNGGGMSRLLICLFCCWPHSVSVYSWPVPAGPACQTRHACMLARPNLSTALSIQYDYHEPTPPPVSGAHMNQYFLQGRKCSLPMGQCHTITLYRPKRQVWLKKMCM